MLIKAGVDISRLKKEIRGSLNKISEFVEEHNEELIIISTYEGNHSPGSLHYANEAYDFNRPIKYYHGSVEALKKVFPEEFDIIWKIDHIHIEHDPKKD